MKLNLSEETLKGMIEEADKDKDGQVNLDDFRNLMKKVKLLWNLKH